MSLIMDKQEKVFDCSTIKRGDLISAQHSCWKEPKSGIVSAVTPEEIKILYRLLRMLPIFSQSRQMML